MGSDQDFLERIYITSVNIIRREIAGEIILVPIRNNVADMQKIFALDPVSDFIWQQFDGERTIGDIHSEVLAAYEVENEQALNDLKELVQGLSDEDLIDGAG